MLEAYHLKLDPRRVVSTLSVGERQRIEIVRALLLNPRLLIMDEPTSVLTPQEVEQLFETLRKLAVNGCSILYISHKLHEIVALCDTATILRGGKVVAHCDPKRETSRSMAEMMIGANLKEISKPASRGLGALKLSAQGLNLPKPSEFGVALKDVAINVKAGEIFGIAGVAGNGQNELMSAMSGETLAPAPGAITLVGQAGRPARRDRTPNLGPMRGSGRAQRPCGGRRVLAYRQWRAHRSRPHGHGALRPHRSRQGQPITPPDVIGDVYSEGDRTWRARGLALRRKPAEVHHGARDPAAAGGARRLPADLGSGRRARRAAIHQAIVDLAARGSAIMVISQDLDELLTLCDTIAVINLGRLSAPMKVGEVSIEEIGLLMGGVHGDPVATVEMTEALHAHPA